MGGAVYFAWPQPGGGEQYPSLMIWVVLFTLPGLNLEVGSQFGNFLDPSVTLNLLLSSGYQD